MDEIAAARQREVNGTATDLDRWRLRAAERREQIVRKDTGGAIDSYFVHSDDALEADTVRAIYQDVAESLDRLGIALSNQIRALEREVSELRGELKALRGTKAGCSCGNGPKILRPDQ